MWINIWNFYHIISGIYLRYGKNFNFYYAIKEKLKQIWHKCLKFKPLFFISPMIEPIQSKCLNLEALIPLCNTLWGKCEYKKHNRNINTINISAIKIHIYINTFTHGNQGNEFFSINKCNEPTGDGTTTFHPTIDWMSQVSLQPIIPVPYSKHECEIS